MDAYEQGQIIAVSQNLWQDDGIKQSNEKTLALFKRFIMEFKTNTLIFKYKELLMSNLQKNDFYLEVLQEDLINWDTNLSKVLYEKPTECIPIVS
jgi:DNA replicative helicase MCM subunit Mcm2 (Cdc46/Mcm family)